MQQRPISFPDWKNVLANAAIDPALRAVYARDSLSCLRHGTTNRPAITQEVAENDLDWRAKPSTGPAHPTVSAGSPQAGPFGACRLPRAAFPRSGPARSTPLASTGNDPVICNALYYIYP